MKESQSLQRLSRRGFLGVAAGTAVAAGLAPVRSPRAAAASLAATGPLAGATVDAKSYGVTNSLRAARIADGLYKMPLCTTIQKIYMNESEFGAAPPRQMKQLAPAGCQFVVSAKPSRQLSSTEQTRLSQWLDMLNQAGMNYRIVLWQESNNSAFPRVDEWQTYWSYYAPIVQAAGVRCGYDAGCHNIARAVQFIPSDPTPDELWMDFYASAYRQGVRLDPFLAAAQAAGISSLGLAEWGFMAGNSKFNPVTIAQWDDFCNYLIFLANGGNFNLGAIFFGGLGHFGLVDVITSPDDPRLPMLRKVSAAVKAG
jgi:hypothetical protein